MGLRISKHNSSSSGAGGSSSSKTRNTNLKSSSSCLGGGGSHRRSSDADDDNDNNHPQVSVCPSEDNGKTVSRPTENKSCPPCQQPPHACYDSADKAEQSDDMNCTTTMATSSSRSFSSSRSLNPPTRFLSRFGFHPGNLSFRLSRATSLGSARSYPASSRSFAIPNRDEEECVGSSGGFMSRNVNTRGCDFFPACFTNRTTPRGTRDDSGFSNDYRDNRELNSDHDVTMSRNDTRPNLFPPVNRMNSDGGNGLRYTDRRASAREPVERNVRFSRTLSVGRLRDRVLRRTPPADIDLHRFQQDSELRHTRTEVGATSVSNNFSEPVSSDDVSSGFTDPYGSQNHVNETPRARETRYRDLLEHRSNFLERRRRIRSQVRALQRLGSRFENLSGHERACILSGQHRGGHCTCRHAARETNTNDDPNARASISRIVMLAEALFEVLDEIHQQSVVLSSRPSVSSIGSIPAPNEVVDSLPLKIFSKWKRKPSDDTAQCYICLVEYDDGDSMRILPCHHEFHRACVDKWLKEVHRVCPLCRGDICHPDSLNAPC